MTFKPLLAAPAVEGDFRFPLFASAKLDGLRAMVHPHGLMSRSMKPFTNKATADFFHTPALVGFDGELIVGMPNAKDVFNRSTSELRNGRGDPKATFFVFDLFNMPGPYLKRLEELQRRVAALPEAYRQRVIVLQQQQCDSLQQLLDAETIILNMGFEGVITRALYGPYKQGRSTVNEQTMLKLKRFADAEAELIGIVEQLTNNNPAFTSEIGRTKRASIAENMAPAGTMGAIVVRDIKSGVVFSIGTGFDFKMRDTFWSLRNGQEIVIEAIVNDKPRKIAAWVPKRKLIVKYKYFQIGTQFRPRFPVFLGERMAEDMSS